MALQVWLPLNGSIENQGLTNVAVSLQNGTPTFANDGKIGKCFYNSSSGSNISVPCDFLSEQLSITFWIKPNSPTAWMDLFSIGQYANRMETNDSNGSAYYLFTDDTSHAVAPQSTELFHIPNGIWSHVAYIIDGINVKVYLNGELKKTISQISSLVDILGNNKYIYIGRRRTTESAYYQGYYNDFRIYDNALSDREIHEISKGLVVHYPLNDVYCTGSSNLYSGEYAEGKCSHGAFSPTKLSGERGYNYKLNYTGNGGNNWHSFGFPTIPFTVGKTYDYSCKIRCRTNNCSLYMRASRCCNDWTTNMKYIDPNGVWTEYHIRQTMTGETFLRSGTADTPKTAPELEFFTGAMSTNGTVYAFDLDIKDVQICEANTSVEFADGSFNTNTVYDVSGFGNHGVRSGKLYIDSDSPRNNCCYNYNQTGYIHRDNFETYFSQFTIAYWVKIPSSITAQHFICGTFNNWTGNGFGAWRDGSAQNGYSCIMKSAAESNYGSFRADGIPHNTWTHIAYVYTGTQIKTYINGSLVDTKTYGSNGQCYMPNLFLGNSMFGNRITENDEASMSDFRLYATALSDKDIVELYNTPMCITNNGVLMTQGEFKEV